MRKITFRRHATSLMAVHDAAIVLEGEDPAEALFTEAVQGLATEVELTLGDTKVTLAMLQDPDHWADDWEERGIDDVDAFLASLVQEDT